MVRCMHRTVQASKRTSKAETLQGERTLSFLDYHGWGGAVKDDKIYST
jgi:hypothetical protein